MPANVMMIVADQLSARALAAFGGGFVPTPNIDRLVRSGVRFNDCSCATPLCQPTRASLWTGLYPHETGVTSNGGILEIPQIREAVATLGAGFSTAGWNCIHVGKQHDAGSLRGFTCLPVAEVNVEPTPPWGLSRDTQVDADSVAKAVDVLTDYQGEQPYFLIVDLNNPHDICGYVGRHAGAHVNEAAPSRLPPLPANFHDLDIEQRPKPVQYVCCAHRRQAQAGPWTEENYRYYLGAYYHYVERLDADIGRILDALDARADVENTLLVFLADHGDAMAAHGLVTKHTTFYDETVRVPLSFSGAGVSGRDRVVKTICSQLDLLPTLAEWAGMPIPGAVGGISLMPWIRDEANDEQAVPSREFVVCEWYSEWGHTIEPGRMLRTQRYKYICYREENGEEFFDLSVDPGETRSLVGNPKHKAELDRHRALLRAHCEATEDPFFSLDIKVEPRWRRHEPGVHNHHGLSAPEEAGVT